LRVNALDNVMGLNKALAYPFQLVLLQQKH